MAISLNSERSAMKQELESALYEKYPKIFEDRHKPMTETCMCWGIECSDGWYNIIDNLCSNIQHRIDQSVEYNIRDQNYNSILNKAMAGDKNSFHEYFKQSYQSEERMKEALEKGLREVRPVIPQVVAEQVKEKFGTLRFYYRGGDDYISGLVSMAESMTSVTCEECGNTGTASGSGWIRTLCETHRKSKNDM
jgi:hypothetical protein